MQSSKKTRGIFICGTDTNVGKTITAATLMHNLADQIPDLRYWKPVQTGLDDNDRHRTITLSQLPEDRFLPELYHFQEPLSPHRAAELDNIKINSDALVQQTKIYLNKFNLIVEGAGGLLVPLTRHFTWLDLLIQCQLEVLLVARSGLGTINHSLLSIEVLRHANLQIAGIVFCGPHNSDNQRTICEMGNIDCLAAFDWQPGQKLPDIFLLDHFSTLHIL